MFENQSKMDQTIMFNSLHTSQTQSRRNLNWDSRIPLTFKSQSEMTKFKKKQDQLRHKLQFNIQKNEEDQENE